MPFQIITREQALEKGHKRYFDGLPCRKGHIAERVFLGKSIYGVCVACKKITSAKYRDSNRDDLNEKSRNDPNGPARKKRYLKRHPTRRKKSAIDWHHRNKDKPGWRKLRSARIKKRQKEDANFRFRKNLRSRQHKALTRVSAAKSAGTFALIGCTADELWVKLESMFTAGMTRANYGHGPGKWNVDHRIPCSSFDLTDPEQQRVCFHYSNLQPLWHVDNVAKAARLDWKQGESNAESIAL
jgi:hypothetical protein